MWDGLGFVGKKSWGLLLVYIFVECLIIIGWFGCGEEGKGRVGGGNDGLWGGIFVCRGLDSLLSVGEVWECVSRGIEIWINGFGGVWRIF
jgi:hypothetical protein